MKFYSDIEGNQSVIIGDKVIEFKNGVYETGSDFEIAMLLKHFRSDSSGQAEQGNAERPEIERKQEEAETKAETKELNKNQIVKLLWERGIEHNKRQSRDELLALLEEGVQE